MIKVVHLTKVETVLNRFCLMIAFVTMDNSANGTPVVSY